MPGCRGMLTASPPLPPPPPVWCQLQAVCIPILHTLKGRMSRLQDKACLGARTMRNNACFHCWCSVNHCRLELTPPYASYGISPWDHHCKSKAVVCSHSNSFLQC